MTANNKKGRYWTLRGNNTEDLKISLKDHFDSLLAARDKAEAEARAGMEKRLDGMNEFRDALKDQSSKFVTRAEVIALTTFIAVLFGLLFNYLRIGK